ncbi:MAG: hypothetical protein ABMA02_08320 [Saprospiraceae bacterium]
MTKITLILFWVLWLLDVVAALYAHREFIMGVFGRYAAPTPTYILMWTALILALLVLLFGSLYLKNHNHPWAALIIAAIPAVLSLPFLLYIGTVIILRPNWR